MKNRRKDLRRKSTDAEKFLWEKLRKNKLGVKFFRQYSLDGYVMDFYCPKKRLGIELEGKIHLQPINIKYDEYRKKYIESFGIKVVYIQNKNIESEIDKTVIEIKKMLEN